MKKTTSISEDNGILAKVPGHYVAMISEMLQPPATAEDRDYDVVLEAGHAGTVRLFARKDRYSHGKSFYRFWRVFRAEPVDKRQANPGEDAREPLG